MHEDFTCEKLDENHVLYRGDLPCHVTEAIPFDMFWNLHPAEFPEILIHGRPVKTPRWQQAYGRDYYFSNKNSAAQPTPSFLIPALAWTQDAIDNRLNGILVNWYDGILGHYIGHHRDSTAGMAADSPIVTISFGEERIFRMRPWKGSGMRDYSVGNGSVIIVPFKTNSSWTHEVTRRAADRGRRISATFRAFT